MASILSILFLLTLIQISLITASPTVEKPAFLSRQLDARADPRCLRGFRSTRGRAACCAPGCRRCGGSGCGRPLGASLCCDSAIERSGRRCDTVGAPCIASSNFRRPNRPDPRCRNGLLRDGVCCPEGCGRCGGSGCRGRTPPGTLDRSCCRGFWLRQSRFCDRVGAPCVIRNSVSSTPTPVDRSRWIDITNTLSGRPTPRHEACMAWLDGKGYLIGGRGDRPTEIFDPASETWSEGASIGVVLHHMQCVGWGGRIWIASAWTGGFPFEQEVAEMYVYNVNRDEWSTRPGLPARRRRGGAAQVLFDDKIFVIGGNRGGHGAHATSLGWVDMYDLNREEWVTDLPELPEERDHFQGAVVNNEKICVSGGRDGGTADFFTATITSTYCYTPTSRRDGVWEDMNANLPGNGRGGTMATTTCNGEMMIVGGERLSGPASDEVDLFDGESWRRTRAMNSGRHGGGLVTSDCSTCGKIFAVSGSGNRGGGPELDSTEMYDVGGVDFECSSF